MRPLAVTLVSILAIKNGLLLPSLSGIGRVYSVATTPVTVRGMTISCRKAFLYDLPLKFRDKISDAPKRLIFKDNAGVAQLAEQLTCNQ